MTHLLVGLRSSFYLHSESVLGMQPIPPSKGPSFREMQNSYGEVWRERNQARLEVEELTATNKELVKEIEQLRRNLRAREILTEALKKRLDRVTSASRSSTSSAEQVPAKRPRPPGLLQEEKTKKLAAEPPRPSCAAKPTMRVTSASRST